MPAHNEERAIGAVLEDLRAEGYRNVIVVNDGSRDRTAEIAKRNGAVVISHPRNLGLGAALNTGLRAALEHGADCAITFDSDGQHNPKDVKVLIESIGGADLVIGARRFVGIPLHKRVGNFGLNLITNLLGGPLVDSQSGLRAFNRRALKQINVRSNRYEVSSEIVIQAKRKGLRIIEAPVTCFFTEYSKTRGTTIVSGFRIAIGLFRLRAAMG